MASERLAGAACARWLVYITTVLLFALLIIGAYVTVGGFGEECPDWPTCHGRLVPQFTWGVLVEYSHRLLSAITGLMLLISTLVIWRLKPRPIGAARSLLIAAVLLILQILLGAVVVGSGLNAVITTAHQAVAMTVFASVVVAATLMATLGRKTN